MRESLILHTIQTFQGVAGYLCVSRHHNSCLWIKIPQSIIEWFIYPPFLTFWLNIPIIVYTKAWNKTIHIDVEKKINNRRRWWLWAECLVSSVVVPYEGHIWPKILLTGLQSKSGIWIGENRLSVRPSVRRQQFTFSSCVLLSFSQTINDTKVKLGEFVNFDEFFSTNTKFCDLDLNFALQWTHTDIDFILFSFIPLIIFMPYLVGL